MHLYKHLLGNIIAHRMILRYSKRHTVDKPLSQPVNLFKSVNITASRRFHEPHRYFFHGFNKLDKIKALKVP
jgi:hypothetical protein